jgi:uncharacterized protein
LGVATSRIGSAQLLGRTRLLLLYVKDAIMPDAAITVVVHRRVKTGRETEYLQLMHEFVDVARRVDGHLGMQILLPAAGARDYAIIDRFADQAARDRFTASSEYRAWMGKLADLTDGDPRIDELTGLEGWFASGDAPTLPKPPKYKMAVATFLGVFPVTTALGLGVSPMIANWPLIPRNAVFSALVVVALTWIVMPLITRILHPWMFSPSDQLSQDHRTQPINHGSALPVRK